MRTVRNGRGITWIRLELPRVPSERETGAATHRMPALQQLQPYSSLCRTSSR